MYKLRSRMSLMKEFTMKNEASQEEGVNTLTNCLKCQICCLRVIDSFVSRKNERFIRNFSDNIYEDSHGNLRFKTGNPCHLYCEGKGCSSYDNRPSICILYPYIPIVIGKDIYIALSHGCVSFGEFIRGIIESDEKVLSAIDCSIRWILRSFSYDLLFDVGVFMSKQYRIKHIIGKLYESRSPAWIDLNTNPISVRS